MSTLLELDARFAERVALARGFRGLSQTELADCTGCLNRMAVGRIESRRRAATISEAAALAAALEVPLADLIGPGPLIITQQVVLG